MQNESTLSMAVQGPILILLLAFALFELYWAKKNKKQIHDPKETLTNFAIFGGLRVTKTLLLGYSAFLFEVASDFAVTRLEVSALVVVVTFLATDFVYYLYHRASHEIRVLWCMHLVHHSSPRMNLTTAGRLNWLSPLLSPFVYIPLVLVGLPANVVVASMAVNLLFQYFLHTEAIDRVPFVEGIFNTPSAHRVHHASNPQYIDKNYGGVLMVWDRLFGTYAVEEGPITYGVTTGFQGYNPLWLVFGGFVDLARGRLSSKG